MTILYEKFIASTTEPSTLLWINGTTDKRYDIAGNRFVKRDKLSYDNPMYLTNNINYAFNYLKLAITKDDYLFSAKIYKTTYKR